MGYVSSLFKFANHQRPHSDVGTISPAVATDNSGGAWFTRTRSEHTTFYNRAVLFDAYLCWRSILHQLS